MPTNVEIKAKMFIPFEKMRKLAELCTPYSDSEPGSLVITQEDTFFNCGTGRLKLRHEICDNNENATLIAYDRPPGGEDGEPMVSKFLKTPVINPQELEEILGKSLGIIGKLRKERELFVIQKNGLQTRIHLDKVQGLGDFIEFEVCLREASEEKIALEEVIPSLKEYFQIKESDLLQKSYMEVLLNKIESEKK